MLEFLNTFICLSFSCRLAWIYIFNNIGDKQDCAKVLSALKTMNEKSIEAQTCISSGVNAFFIMQVERKKLNLEI